MSSTILDRDNCLHCKRCASVCPNDALTVYGREMTVDEIFEAVAADKNFYDNSGGGVTLSGGECLFFFEFCAELHKKYTGVSNELILENLKYIDSLGCKTEIRIPCVPGCNDRELEKIDQFVGTLKNTVRTRILEYHDMARSKFSALGLPCTLPEKAKD